MNLAVITIAHGRHDHLALQQRGLAAGDRQPDQYLTVAMGDPHLRTATAHRTPQAQTLHVPVRDGHLPLAAARNAGARQALDRRAELLVFLDVDCVPGPATLARYAEVAEDGALWCGAVHYLPPPPAQGYALSSLPALAGPHPARPVPPDDAVQPGGDPDLFWSLSFAVTADTWRAIGGFHEGYVGYGAEDTDFARLARSAGADLRWVGGAPVYHQYHPVSRPPVEHLDDILRNGEAFQRRWGAGPCRGGSTPWNNCTWCAMTVRPTPGSAPERTRRVPVRSTAVVGPVVLEPEA
ncbi:glycosyltransferase family 2 protein [Streptacidiphilus sp. PB12-B1b]|uniref:glycosyltransferase family 2 protein n=1 Tax=Streptacidiphilus sp. PB12-B1b TaxID=2705012 RepID=UPI001CDB8BC8|nr:galactosyltransferase-related protein [Streptacidiphilus sp. PB12-B1b]